ncbi:MAG: sigma-70 family RNA polymerase sigma factor [Chloroflexota bacterium]|nr:sigma-70 family RNA polymerase sigma factor [Dehalococcoidia bacterium]MDW8252304.1 sigma-70 family RNA polymerase sigma factor [Chloroflexota bacterium]
MIDYQGAEDEVLVARLAAKDAAALEALYDRHARPVFSLALRMLGDVTAAEEIVQEVFLKLWRSPERFVASRGTFRSWILGVTHHRAVDELRSRRAESLRRVAGGEAEAETLRVPDTAPDPAEAAWRGVQHQIVRRALETLPTEQREVIELAYFKGLTHSEIAATLGEPLGTVKTRLRLAIQKLRAALAAEQLWVGKR